MEFLEAMQEIDDLGIRELFENIFNIFLHCNCHDNQSFSFDEIKSILKSRNILFDDVQLNYALNILVSAGFETIVRDDYYSGKTSYRKLSERFKASDYSMHYCNFIDDMMYQDKKFVLIADTHIGNGVLQDFKVLDNIYDYCNLNDISVVFHLGDVFDGVKPANSQTDLIRGIDNDYGRGIISQIKDFNNNYPNCNGIITYSVCGNHDVLIHGSRGTENVYGSYVNQFCDLKKINRYNSSFKFYGSTNIVVDFSGIDFRFGHRFFSNFLCENRKITDINQIDDDFRYLPRKYPVCISGHLHSGLIYMNTDCNGDNVCILGVPSTSQVNLGNAIAYVINLKHNCCELDHMDIIVIESDNNSRIYEGDVFTYNFNHENKVLKKVFK